MMFHKGGKVEEENMNNQSELTWNDSITECVPFNLSVVRDDRL